MSRPEHAHFIPLAGPPHLRQHGAHNLLVWQPHGVLDDRLADEIVEWVSVVEKNSPPFDRFVDFSCLAKISLSIGHVFTLARERAWKYGGTEAVKSAFFCEELVGFGMARLFETLMEESPIKVRAFRDRAAAVKWLGVPAEILNLQLDPQPSDNSTRARVWENRKKISGGWKNP